MQFGKINKLNGEMKMKIVREVLGLISSVVLLLTSFVLVGGMIYVLGHMDKEPFEVDFTMDNNTANAVHDMMNLANMTIRECPYCPCSVLEWNGTSYEENINYKQTEQVNEKCQ